MIADPRFLTISEVLEIHKLEIQKAGGLDGIRDVKSLEAALSASQATFDSKYVMDLFEMAATYVNSIVFNHPFLDGNKRTGLASCLTFLYINGYSIEEKYDVELADKTLELVEHKISKMQFADFLRERSREIE
jgi:death-on-curing protein